MDIQFQHGQEHWKADILFAPFCAGTSSDGRTPREILLSSLSELDTLCPWLAVAPAMRDLSMGQGKVTLVHGHPDLAIPRVLFVGLGKEEDFSLGELRANTALAVQQLKELGLTSMLVPISLLEKLPADLNKCAEEVSYALECALYDAGLYKKKDPDEAKALATLFYGCPKQSGAAAEKAALFGRDCARAQNLARTLANTPGNLLTPAELAEKARELSEAHGLSCQVLDEKEMKNQGLNALLAVGQGSSHPPRLVILEYCPEGHKKDRPFVLVGKGISFDSGGISLKPAAKMHEMKSDMSGAAAVLSAMTLMAEANLEKRVLGLLACAENMPGGSATRPGDVVYCYNKESIEITNTDAEGRLVLVDALSYALKNYDPIAMVDIATLTGACAVALGDEIAGFFCEDEALSQRISQASKESGEPFWRLPLWKPYAKKLKSQIADICHTGPREGGAINAAIFLQHFVPDIPFAHLDIAGVDFKEEACALFCKGATGFGTRTLFEIVRGGGQ